MNGYQLFLEKLPLRSGSDMGSASISWELEWGVDVLTLDPERSEAPFSIVDFLPRGARRGRSFPQ